MDILLVMCLGILVGRFLFPQKAKRWNEGASLLCTLVLIFSMGAMLGLSHSHRFVHCGGVRPYQTLYEAPQPG